MAVPITGTRTTKASGRRVAAATTSPTRGSCPGWRSSGQCVVARQRGLPADLVHWMAVRDEIYEQIMTRGWNEERGAFVQHYDADVLDASVLLMPLVKFVAPTDPRWLSTLDAISRSS